jgi:hypothetical protein
MSGTLAAAEVMCLGPAKHVPELMAFRFILLLLAMAGPGCRRAAAPEVAPISAPPDAAWMAPCGEAGQPPCPLEAWMEDQLSAPLLARDWDHLVRSAERLAAHAPAAYPRWAELARAVLSGAQAKDKDAVKASCDGCHGSIRDDYRVRMHGRPAPPADPAPGSPAPR